MGASSGLPNANLVLHLPLLPAHGGCAGKGLEQIVVGQAQEAAIELALLAAEDGIYDSLEIVVDEPSGHAAEESERPVMRLQHHLLGLTRVTPEIHMR